MALNPNTNKQTVKSGLTTPVKSIYVCKPAICQFSAYIRTILLHESVSRSSKLSSWFHSIIMQALLGIMHDRDG